MNRNNFDDMINGLKQEIEVPREVWIKYTDTLSGLPDKREDYGAGKNRWMKYAASAAAVAMVGSAVCFADPAFAEKIPLIGKIFQEVQQTFSFPGEYDTRAEILNTEDVNMAEGLDPEYTVENSGVTFTASEVYCDGLSVFLTAEVEVEQGGLKKMPGGLMYLGGEWKTDDDTESKKLMNNNLEGKVIDDQTFIGMLKLDLENTDIQGGTVELQLSSVGYDDIEELDREDNDASHRIEGEWKLSVPFSVDTKACSTIQVNQENQGYCLREVFVSPYQVISYTDVPYTEQEITPEEFEEIMKEKTGGSDDPGITYEEYTEKMGKDYADCLTVIFDQDGERLTPREETRGRCVNALQGKKITKLYIYVFDNMEAWMEMDENGMDSEAAKEALIAAEVEVA